MGKSTPSAPPQPQAPDPAKTAAAQTASNVKTAVAQSWLNSVNQKTPYGNLTYTPSTEGNGGTTIEGQYVPTWTASQTLSPAGQKLQDTNMSTTQQTADLANQYAKRIATATANPYSYDGLPAAPTFSQDYVNKATNDIIARNQPQMDRDRANLEQRLADQGVGLNDPGYRTAFDQYQRGVNDFRLGAQTQGMGQAMNLYNLKGNSRDRAINEMANLRSQPINEVAALLGTGTSVQNPQFINSPQSAIQPTDVAGIYNNNYQTQMANYLQGQQMTNAQNAATTGGLFGLGGTVLGAGLKYGLPLIGSDIRMKENIRHIGHTTDGQKLYSFNYIGNPKHEIGLMAQEVERIKPDAVHEIDGLKYVDYAKALADA